MEETKEEIKKGDVVSLKSDDHMLFTVGSVDNLYAEIYWFDHNEKSLKAKNVPKAILTK